MPPQVCHSCCSVIHPIGEHNHRSYFLQNQKPVIRMERSTDFFSRIARNPSPKATCCAGRGVVTFNIQIAESVVQGISHRYGTQLQCCDGYAYFPQPAIAWNKKEAARQAA
ncbi:MAG: hypothetical protein P8179_08730 [Candidatus Thiodiazotropha sp.]